MRDNPNMLTRAAIVDGRGRAFFRHLEDHLERASQTRAASGAPYITLAYAQSLDGSIAARPGQMLRLSNPLSQAMTHHLRARHDAILVGINTVLSDDPRLTVRLASGKDPRPVVIDGCLRTPLSARLLTSPGRTPIVATSHSACAEREERLRKAGALVVRVPSRPDGRLDLLSFLALLAQMNIGSLMVEGGAGILNSFLSERLADQIVVTISPRFVGGVPALAHGSSPRAGSLPRLRNVRHQSLGGDLIVWGDLKRSRRSPQTGARP
jgi:3,4-dihydroxy 2-butanone 4-phosphate synthase/GTP cyclohydrolase II